MSRRLKFRSLSNADRGSLIRSALAFAAEDEPAESLSYETLGVVRRVSVGWSVVPLQQLHCGIPVMDGIRAVRFDDQGAPVAITGRSIAIDESAPIVPRVTPQEAARVAFLELARVGSIPSILEFSAAAPLLQAQFGTPNRPTVLVKTPLTEPILASLVLDGSGRRPRLLWNVLIRLPVGGGGFVLQLDAVGRSRVPVVRSLVRSSSHATSGMVFEFDPRSEATAVPFPRGLEHYAVRTSSQSPSADWVMGGETRGNNVDVRAPNGRVQARQSQGDLLFEAAPPQSLEGAAVNAFYLCNFLHDFFYLLGFNEVAGTFQERNTGSQEGPGDPLSVLIQKNELPGLAFFDNRTDGNQPVLELGPHVSGRHSAFDAHLVVHEFAHGVTNRVLGSSGSLHTPLRHEQSRALGEGMSDYWAISIQNHYRRKRASAAGLDPTLSQEWCFAPWLSGNAAGLRSRSYENHPGRYGWLTSSGMDEHTAGEVWCATLLDLNRVLGEGDPDIGDQRGWRLVFDALGFLHPGKVGPQFLHARDSVLCAFDLLVAKGQLDAGLRPGVLLVFRDRGLGGDARSKGARYRDAKEGTGPIGDDYRENCS